MKNNKLKDKIKILEIKIRHLKNQHEVVKKQYEKTTKEYLKILDDVFKTNKQLQQEIAERKKTEETLRESEEKFRTFMETASDLMHIADKDGNITYVNESMASDLGYSIKQMIGTNVTQFLSKEEVRKKFKQNWKKLLTKGRINIEANWKTKDGKDVFCETAIVAVYDSNGKYAGSRGICSDITERKRAESELKRSHEQLRALTEHLHQVREEERTFIAREIHDELGQALTALKMDISWIKRNLPEKIYPLHEKIKSMTELVDKTIQTTKEMSAELRPSILDDFGLDAAIEWYAKEFQNRTEITCEIHADLKELILNKNRSTTIFRIFQESLTNVARHADATKVKVNVRVVKSNLVLRIKDNGKGITEKQINDSKSFGLIGMRERLILLTGKLKIYSVKDKGATIVATIPLERRRKSR